MKKHAFIIFLILLYSVTQVCIEFGKEFMSVGAAKLHDYTWSDWLVLAVPTCGSVGLTLIAFFSKAFSSHMAELEKRQIGQMDLTVRPPAIVTVERPATAEAAVLTPKKVVDGQAGQAEAPP